LVSNTYHVWQEEFLLAVCDDDGTPEEVEKYIGEEESETDVAWR
jgi:hypothetical protein